MLSAKARLLVPTAVVVHHLARLPSDAVAKPTAEENLPYRLGPRLKTKRVSNDTCARNLRRCRSVLAGDAQADDALADDTQTRAARLSPRPSR